MGKGCSRSRSRVDRFQRPFLRVICQKVWPHHHRLVVLCCVQQSMQRLEFSGPLGLTQNLSLVRLEKWLARHFSSTTLAFRNNRQLGCDQWWWTGGRWCLTIRNPSHRHSRVRGKASLVSVDADPPPAKAPIGYFLSLRLGQANRCSGGGVDQRGPDPEISTGGSSQRGGRKRKRLAYRDGARGTTPSTNKTSQKGVLESDS